MNCNFRMEAKIGKGATQNGGNCREWSNPLKLEYRENQIQEIDHG